MIILKVCEFLCISDLLSSNKGRVLRQKITELLNSRKCVCLDFGGYTSLSSSFLSEALGKLIIENNWTKNKFKEKVSWKNLNEDDEIIIELSIENALTKLYLIKHNIDQVEFYKQNLPAV